MTINTGFFVTSDNTKLHYIESGAGPVLVMVPGWSQTAEQYKYQIEEISSKYHCIAINMRGHGDSENVNHGFTIERLAKDLHEFISALGKENICLMGHSLGCSVIWGLLYEYGQGLINKLIFIDEPPCLMNNPDWDTTTKENAGALFTSESLQETCLRLNGPNSKEFRRTMIKSMINKELSPAEEEWILECNLKLKAKSAAELLTDHVNRDWRDIFSGITVPTLIIGAEGSQVPWKSQRWIHERIQGSELVLFKESDCVKHFMFYEKPEKFNRIVKSFLS